MILQQGSMKVQKDMMDMKDHQGQAQAAQVALQEVNQVLLLLNQNIWG